MCSPAPMRYWAEHDAPSQMRRYQEETVRSMLVGDVRHSLVRGPIQHSHFAAYLYFRFRNAYVTHNVTKTIAHWYEFLTPSSRDSSSSGDAWACSPMRCRAAHRLPHVPDLSVHGHQLHPMDALDFLLYYFSTSLDWLSKESLFLIIQGGECHAANAQIRMFDGSVELVQNVRVGDLLMGDDNKSRTVRKLRVAFNGEDHGLEVNEHHVLSLKFMDVHEVVSQRGGGEDIHYVIWHCRCGIDEPARVEVAFASVKAARAYLASVLRSDKRAITKGNVIDIQARYELALPYGVLLGDCIELIYSLGLKCIKVFAPRRDRETWCCLVIGGPGLDRIPSRMPRQRVFPRQEVLTTQFSIQYTRPARYFGFELDGNHRYLTGDYYVHHNSNGKSVLMELFRWTLGEMYTRKMPLNFITDKSCTRASSADPAVMKLKGARMAYYSESDRNEKVNVAKVKEITSGEALSGRQLYKE
ncbi:hypothetical protein PI124_g16684 [Phytophthora idaei]|nr:hypothetical protein PI125_g19880 [Phytophthora idaei]KAG3238351.1 hypothetical protein PI124_g16684 [Phytophthora idaei]